MSKTFRAKLGGSGLTGVIVQLGLVQVVNEVLDHLNGTVHLEVSSDEEFPVCDHI
jgi:hypothetical protein